MDNLETNSGANQMPMVAIVGALNADLILEQVNVLPALEKERIAEGMTFTMGSSSAILGANAGALGLPVGFIGRIGNDTFGNYMRRDLAQRGVDTDCILETPDVATGLTVIFTFQGKWGMLTYPGAMSKLTIDDMPWVILSSGVDIEEFVENLRFANAAGGSGFLCGRAVWKHIVDHYPDRQAMYRHTNTEGCSNFRNLLDVDSSALPWFEHCRFAVHQPSRPPT